MEPAGVLIAAPPAPEDAPLEKFRALDGFEDLAQAYLSGWSCQRVAPDGSPVGLDHAMPGELLEDLGEKASGKMAGLCNLP